MRMIFCSHALLGSMSLIILLCTPSLVFAQSEIKADIKLVTEETLAPRDKTIRQVFIQRDNKLQERTIHVLEEKIELTLPDASKIELTRNLESAVSLDGKTIVQYGDEIDQSHPSRTNIFWKDSSGKTVAQVVDTYAEEALVALSPNGFTAVVGRLLKDRARTMLGLYSARGELLWKTTLRLGQRASRLKLTKDGRHVVLATTDRLQWLTEHQLHIFDQSGTDLFSTDDFRIIQKIVATDDGDHLFVQGYDDYGVVRISSASILWRNQGKIRMTSPEGAATSPDGRTLFLSLADFQGKRQRLYRWQLIGLDTTDGKEIFSEWLPGEFPGTRERVFEQLSADTIQIRTDSKRLIYSWKRSQEGN